jgi:hypothetical protein
VQSLRAKSTYHPGEHGIAEQCASRWGLGGAMARCAGSMRGGRLVVDSRYVSGEWKRVLPGHLSRQISTPQLLIGKPHRTTIVNSNRRLMLLKK